MRFVAPLLVAVLGAAFVSKLLALDELRGVIVATGMFSPGAARGVAALVLVTEGATILALLRPGTRPLGYLLASILFSAFAAYHGWRLKEGIGVPCTCFGTLFKMTSPVGLGLCLVLATLSQAQRTVRTPVNA